MMTPDSNTEPNSLSGKTVLITGATSGIGFQTATALAQRGAVVYVTGRNEDRGRNAERELRTSVGHAGVHFIRADSSTVEGNQQLAARVLTETDELHILVNNVGGLYNDRWETDDGYEATLAMNLVGPFALTEALLSILQQSAPARIVNVTSSAYGMWEGDPFADVHAEQSYLGIETHARTKLLNLLWTFALARRLEGCGIVANAVNPGSAWTPMIEDMAPRSMAGWQRLLWPLFRIIQRRGSAEKAARSSVFAASSPEMSAVTGVYFESDASPKNPGLTALNRETQEKAWDLAASLVANAPTVVHEVDIEQPH